MLFVKCARALNENLKMREKQNTHTHTNASVQMNENEIVQQIIQLNVYLWDILM